MSIKRIIFLFIAIAVSFAVGLGFWTMHTDVVLSPAPEREPSADENSDAGNSGGAIVNGNENISVASPYAEALPDISEGGTENEDAKDFPIE